MKKLVLFSSLIFVFTTCSKKSSVTGTETDVITGKGAYGKIVFDDDDPAEGAMVILTKTSEDTINLLAKRGVPDTTLTDSLGNYSIEGLENAEYNFKALLVELGSNDTLLANRFGIPIEGDTDLGTDTIVKPGKINLQVVGNGKPIFAADCFVPGTSYIAKSDEEGNCLISGVPPGDYEVAIIATGYSVSKTNATNVESEKTRELGSINLLINADDSPPNPTGLNIEYDNKSGNVRLSWDPIIVSDLAGYLLYRDDTSFTLNPTQLGNDEPVVDTFYLDYVYAELSDTASAAFQYRIRATDKSTNTSDFVNFDPIIVTPPNSPKAPNPEDGSIDNELSLTLFWIGINSESGENISYDVYLDTISEVNNLVSPGQSHTLLQVSSLEEDKTYYWKVIGFIAGEEYPGPIWSFSTKSAPGGDYSPPTEPTAPNPAHNSQDQTAGLLVLSWTGDTQQRDDKVLYDIYMSSESPPSIKIATGIQKTNFTAVGLVNSTDYYWQIIASDGNATTRGAIWKFSTIGTGTGNTKPNQPSDPSPLDGGLGIGLSTTLSWTGGDLDTADNVTYSILLATNSTPTTPLVSGLSAENYSISGLSEGTNYYWQIIATDNNGATNTSDVWSFTTQEPDSSNTPPHMPSTLTPTDHSMDQAISLSLIWTGGDSDEDDSVAYTVKFGTVNPPTEIIASSITELTLLAPTLETNTQYFWQITASDGKATTIGPVWDFTTIPPDTNNTAPNKPVATQPLDETSNHELAVTLKWIGGQ